MSETPSQPTPNCTCGNEAVLPLPSSYGAFAMMVAIGLLTSVAAVTYEKHEFFGAAALLGSVYLFARTFKLDVWTMYCAKCHKMQPRREKPGWQPSRRT